MKQINEDNDIFECDEYELHDFVVALGVEGDATVREIVLKATMLTDAEAQELQARVNKVLEAIADLDSHLHDVAEFACG